MNPIRPLSNICLDYNLDLQTAHDLMSLKVTQYVHRDLNLHKEVDIMDPVEQYDRFFKVFETYLGKTLDKVE